MKVLTKYKNWIFQRTRIVLLGAVHLSLAITQFEKRQRTADLDRLEWRIITMQKRRFSLSLSLYPPCNKISIIGHRVGCFSSRLKASFIYLLPIYYLLRRRKYLKNSDVSNFLFSWWRHHILKKIIIFFSHHVNLLFTLYIFIPAHPNNFTKQLWQ